MSDQTHHRSRHFCTRVEQLVSREIVSVAEVDPISCHRALSFLVSSVVQSSFCGITLQAVRCAVKVAKATLPATRAFQSGGFSSNLACNPVFPQLARWTYSAVRIRQSTRHRMLPPSNTLICLLRI